MLEFPQYDPDRPCRKCGFTLTEDAARPFLISRRCLRCKWSWVERTLDYDHEKFLAAEREYQEFQRQLFETPIGGRSKFLVTGPVVLKPLPNETWEYMRSVMPS